MEVDVPTTLTTLSSALGVLEQALAPLLAVPLKEMLANEEEGQQVAPIEQARTQILTAYLVHDLIWSESIAPVWLGWLLMGARSWPQFWVGR